MSLLHYISAHSDRDTLLGEAQNEDNKLDIAAASPSVNKPGW